MYKNMLLKILNKFFQKIQMAHMLCYTNIQFRWTIKNFRKLWYFYTCNSSQLGGWFRVPLLNVLFNLSSQ